MRASPPRAAPARPEGLGAERRRDVHAAPTDGLAFEQLRAELCERAPLLGGRIPIRKRRECEGSE